MTRKHFEAIAKRIAAIENPEARRQAAVAMADVCTQFNTRFNVSRFLSACGVNDGQ